MLLATAPLSAQGLTVTEFGVGGTGVLGQRGFWGPELGVAHRPGGQGRFALTAAGGDYDRVLGVRLEGTAQFLLRPAERRGVGPYAGLGLAFMGAEGTRGAGYLTALLGLESAPGRPGGWYVEVGLGGGVRLAAGHRWRWLPAWW